MDDAPKNGEIQLSLAWGRLDSICGKLWQEDRKAAVGLQAVIEEFRDQVSRAEKTVESLRHTLDNQRKTLELEIAQRFRDAVADLEKQLAVAREHGVSLDRTLARERERIRGLTESLDAKELEIARLQEDYLKTESERDAERAAKMEAFINGLHEKEGSLEEKWIQRRHELEAEFEERGEQNQRAHLDELRALKQRAMEIEKDLLNKEGDLQASHASLRQELELREARLRERESELRRREDELEKAKRELEASWQTRRRELDEIKKGLQEEIKTVVHDYQDRKSPTGG